MWHKLVQEVIHAARSVGPLPPARTLEGGIGRRQPGGDRGLPRASFPPEQQRNRLPRSYKTFGWEPEGKTWSYLSHREVFGVPATALASRGVDPW